MEVTVLIVVGIIVALVILAGVIMFFNEHCEDKFDHAFFTKPMLIILGIAGGLFIWGVSWYNSSVVNAKGYELLGIIFTSETLNGIVLVIIALLIYLGVAIYNFVVTNWIYGFFGTLVQFSLLSIIAYFGVILVVGYFAIMFMLTIFASADNRSHY